MPRIGTANSTSNLAPRYSIGKAWDASQLGEVFIGEIRVLFEEGSHDLFRGYYKRLGADPSVLNAKEAFEFIENIIILLVEKVNDLNRFVLQLTRIISSY